jgi:peroxiredoxin
MTRMLKTLIASVALMLAAAPTLAGERVDPVIGDPAPQFSLDDVVTGQTVNLSEFQGKVVVVAFQSVNCPWDRMRDSGGYQRYLSPLSQQYADQDVVFLAINANKNEAVEELRSYHEQHELPYPILKDTDNVIADAYNAKVTPHVYVIAADEQQTLVYMGGIEQVPTSPEVCGQMDENYLEPVLNAVLAGEELPHTKTTPKGCGIKRVSAAE